MALNKAQTSVGVKIVLVMLIIAFVVSFVSIGSGLFGGGTTSTPQAATGTADSINAQYQSTVAALTSTLQSDPASATVLVTLGNTYFDWAAALQQAAQTDTTAVGTDQPLWVSAKDAYGRAVAAGASEPAVLVDFAITQFYTGDTEAAIKTAEGVRETAPEFAPAYFNLGIFYKAVGRTDDAIVVFTKAVELDPNGTQVNTDYAKSQLTELQSAPSTSTP